MTLGDGYEFAGRSVTVPQVRWARTHDEIDIAYQDFGLGSVLLVVMNGWISHLEVYWEQPRYARFMRRPSASMRVVVFDTRGIGMSDRLTGDVSLETRMDDVKAVLDHAGVDRAALFAWGFGAPALVAFFAATLPERVVALCMDAEIQERKRPDWQWGETDAEFEASTATELASWGKNLSQGYDQTHEDPGLAEWEGRMARRSSDRCEVGGQAATCGGDCRSIARCQV